MSRAPSSALSALLLAAFLTASHCARGADTDTLTQARETELRLIRALVEQGILTRDKARAMLGQAGIDPAVLDAPELPAVPRASASPPTPPASAPVIDEASKREVFEQVRQEVRAQSAAEGRGDVSSLPSWVRKVSFSGDMRLRYIRDDFASDNETPLQIDDWYQLPAGTTLDTQGSHEFLQMRARFNVDAKVNDELKAGIQVVLAAGQDTTASPVDLDVDLGTYGRPFSVAINAGYLQWQPRGDLSVIGGRMFNPYFKSDLIFSPDLSLDGVAVTYAPRLAYGWGGFVNAGAHPLQTNASGPFNLASDQVLYALQGGADWTAADESHLRVGAAYYDFAGIQGKADPVNPPNNTLNDDSAPLFRQFGNTMFDVHYQELNGTATPIAPLYAYAARFRLFDVGGEYEYARFDPVRLAFQADWVRNVGFNAAQVAQRIGAYINALPYQVAANGAHINAVSKPQVNGYLVSMRVGAPELRRWGDWQVFFGERYLQRDAVVDAFTSPDYRLGGTDNQASFLGLNWGLSRAASLTLRYIAARSISEEVPKFGVDTWFLDLNANF